MSRSLDDLLPEVKERACKFLEKCKEQNIPIIVTFTYRSYAEQDELYAQGRTKPGKIVTKARGGQSWHNFRRALDVCPLKASGGDAWWDAPEGLWEKIGSLGESVGLEWGGRWPRFRDYPHFQYIDGLTLAQARANTVNG